MTVIILLAQRLNFNLLLSQPAIVALQLLLHSSGSSQLLRPWPVTQNSVHTGTGHITSLLPNIAFNLISIILFFNKTQESKAGRKTCYLREVEEVLAGLLSFLASHKESTLLFHQNKKTTCHESPSLLLPVHLSIILQMPSDSL